MDLLIAVPIIAGLVVWAIVYALKVLFTQPWLRIRCLRGPNSSRQNRPDYLELTWEQPLEIYNSTTFPALNVSFSLPDPRTALPLQPLEPHHVNGMEPRRIDCKVVREFRREEVAVNPSRFDDLRPPELRSFVLILRYKNDKGIPFYTRFDKKGETEACTYHRRRPKK